jgi:hypothetical protein
MVDKGDFGHVRSYCGEKQVPGSPITGRTDQG